jgi:DNA-binding PadR family transcriptional regulator
MSRWLTHDEDPRVSTSLPRIGISQNQEGRLGQGDGRNEPDRQAVAQRAEAPAKEFRKAYRVRGHDYMLRASEIGTLVEIGKFRALTRTDIEEFLYRDDKGRMEADLNSLRKQGLVTEREIPQREGQPRQLVALTKKGRSLILSTKSVSDGQALYQGFTKPREADHDADLYRLYQRGLEKIGEQGARNIRVVLDSELKRILYRDLARPGEDGSVPSKEAVAEKHGLRVVRNSIPVPDLRIEYEKEDGEIARLDLELATEHYRFRNIARKIQAGFAIYARGLESQNLRRVLDQREITAEIFNL